MRHNITKVHTAPYRLQLNDLVERLCGTLVPMVQKYTDERKDWSEHLPYAL